MKRCSSYVLFALISMHRVATAETLSYTESTGTRTDFSGMLQFPQFTPTLGTLTGVTFNKFAPLTPTMLVRNDSTSRRTATGKVMGWLEYDLPGIAARGDFPENRRRFDFEGSISLNAGQTGTINFTPKTLMPFDDNPTPLANYISDYVGSGTFKFNYKYLVGDDLEPRQHFSWATTFTNSLTGTVNYAYTLAPGDGDFDGDGDVDGGDFLSWQTGTSPDSGSADDLELWKMHFGTAASHSTVLVPEATSAFLLVAGIASSAVWLRRSLCAFRVSADFIPARSPVQSRN